MCGRYELVDGQRVFIRFRSTNKAPLIPDNGDVRPTQHVLVLQADHVLSLMKWGLVPSWAKDPRIGSKMINARAEGIESKPSFKRPLRYQRCIIPASAFFEWRDSPGAKVKYRIARRDGDLFGFAGLYDTWRDPSHGGAELASCTIITTQPNAVVAPIHSGIPEVAGFVQGIQRDRAAVEAGLTLEWSQGQTEGQVHRLKLLKRAMYDIVGECLASSQQCSEVGWTSRGTGHFDQPRHDSLQIERCGRQEVLKMRPRETDVA